MVLSGLPVGARGKEPACQWRRYETWVRSWVEKIPWRRAWQSTLVSLPGESHGQRSLVSYSPWCRRRIGYYLATEQQQPPVVRTWCFHCWGLGSIPGQGTMQCHPLLLSPLKDPQLDLQIRSYLFSFTNYV